MTGPELLRLLAAFRKLSTERKRVLVERARELLEEQRRQR